MQERAAELLRIDEAAGGEAKKAKTEEELSPGTEALLCDEDVMPIEHTSFISHRNEETDELQATRGLAAHETSVLSELAKHIKKIAVRKKCNPCEVKRRHFACFSLFGPLTFFWVALQHLVTLKRGNSKSETRLVILSPIFQETIWILGHLFS